MIDGRIEQLGPSTEPIAGPVPSVRLARFPDEDSMDDCLVGMSDEVAHFFRPGSKSGSGLGNHASRGHTGCSDSIVYLPKFLEGSVGLANSLDACVVAVDKLGPDVE